MTGRAAGRGRGARDRGPAGERGVVGGIEVLPFALLVFVAGTLLVVNAWAVVDAKLAVESAAREAGRAYVEAGDVRTAPDEAESAARDALAGAGLDPQRLQLLDNDPAYLRCEVVEHEARYQLPRLVVPFLGRVGRGTVVTGRHREVIDPFGAGLGPNDACG